MIRKSMIWTEKETNVINPVGESITDKSKFRPDIATTRDKSIAMAQNGGGNMGLYDTDNREIDHETMQAMAYARNPKRDITEIQNAKTMIENTIKENKAKDTEKIKNKIETKELKDTFKKIAENTAKTDTKTTNTNV